MLMKADLINTLDNSVAASGFTVTKNGHKYEVNGSSQGLIVYPAFPDIIFLRDSDFAYVISQ